MKKLSVIAFIASISLVSFANASNSNLELVNCTEEGACAKHPECKKQDVCKKNEKKASYKKHA